MVGGECNTADSHYILKNPAAEPRTHMDSDLKEKKVSFRKRARENGKKKPFTGIEIGARD